MKNGLKFHLWISSINDKVPAICTYILKNGAGIELGTLQTRGRCPTTELHPYSVFFFFFWENKDALLFGGIWPAQNLLLCTLLSSAETLIGFFFFLKTRVYWKGNQYAELYSPCMHPITTGFVFAQHWTTSQWPGTIVWSARAIKDSDIEEASVLWGSVGRGRS